MKNTNWWKSTLSFVGTLVAMLFVIFPKIAGAADSRAAEVKIFSSDSLQLEENFAAFTERFQGGASVSMCDLDGDKTPEIVVGAGPGGGPQVRVFEASGKPKFTAGFFAYHESFRGGVNVACGDLDGDRQAEIITGPKINGGLQVRVFNRFGEPVFTNGFFAYDPVLRGGLHLAIGDLDGSGLNEIITAPTVGLGSLVKVFNRNGTVQPLTFHPFHQNFTGGVSLAAGNIDGGQDDELVMAVNSQDVAWVKIMKGTAAQTIIGEFIAFPNSFKGGVNVSTGDVDRDNLAEIIVAANSGGGPQIKVFESNGQATNINFMAYESDFRGGVQVSSGDINLDGRDEVVTAPAKKFLSGTIDRIEIDLSEQRLYAYEKNQLVRSFLVSTGIRGMDTPVGTFRVSEKIFSKLYSGPGYYFPNTLWNMRFNGSRLLHGAYWHNDFGRRKSHGCVNIAYPNAEWLYKATPVGTTVIVRE